MKNTLAQNAAFSVLYRLFNVIFPLISATYVSRVLSPDGIGRVNLAQNNMSYFLMFASMAIPYYGTREVAKRRNDAEKVNQLFTELMVINFVGTTVCLVLYYFAVEHFFPDDRLIYLVFCLELLFNYINIDWLYQGREEYRYITLRSIAVKAVSLCALFLCVKKPEDYLIYAVIHCCGTGCNYFFNVYHLRGAVKLSFRNLQFSRHIKSLMVLMISSVAASLYNKVDITMLGVLSTQTAVGYYTNAHKVISIVLTLVTALSAVFLPRLSSVYERDRAQYSAYLTIGVKIVLILAVPGCAGIILTAPDLTNVLFGEAFLPMAGTLRILSVFVIIKGAGDLLCYQAIISSGNENKLVSSRVVAGVCNVILNALLIPRYSHQGAAMASVISELIVNGMLIRFSLSVAKPDIRLHFCASLLTSTAAMLVVVTAIQYSVYHPMACLLLSVLCGVITFLISMVVTKNEIAGLAVSKLHEAWKQRSR